MLKKIATTTLMVSALAMATQASAMTGVYVNGNLGYAKQSYDSGLFDPLDTSTSENNFAWNIFVGYNYDLNTQFGLGAELGYADYNEMEWKDNATDSSFTNEQTGWIFQAVGKYHADEMFDIFAKLGFISGKNKENATTAGTNEGSETHTNTKFMTTLGVAYNIMPELAISLQWEHIFGSELSINNDLNEFQTVNAFMTGLTYTFEV